MTCWRTRARSAPEADEHLGGHALALADETEEHVLGADVVVAELQRLAQRQLEHLLGPGGEGRRPGRSRARPGRSSPRPSPGRPPARCRADSSALAATPSPSWMRPRRMCSVPMKLWLSRRASSCASTSTLRARSVKRSNTRPPPSSVGTRSCEAQSVQGRPRDLRRDPILTHHHGCMGQRNRPWRLRRLIAPCRPSPIVRRVNPAEALGLPHSRTTCHRLEPAAHGRRS